MSIKHNTVKLQAHDFIKVPGFTGCADDLLALGFEPTDRHSLITGNEGLRKLLRLVSRHRLQPYSACTGS